MAKKQDGFKHPEPSDSLATDKKYNETDLEVAFLAGMDYMYDRHNKAPSFNLWLEEHKKRNT